MTCPADDCPLPVSGNGAACHDHFGLVPDFLRSAYFASKRRGDFTARWIRAQVRHAVRGEPFAADPNS